MFKCRKTFSIENNESSRVDGLVDINDMHNCFVYIYNIYHNLREAVFYCAICVLYMLPLLFVNNHP